VAFYFASRKVRYATGCAGETPQGLSNRGGLIRDEYKNNIFIASKCLYCTFKMPILQKKGAETVQFLVEHFTVLGFEGQYWMLIVAGLIAPFVFFAWKTRDRN
jgi:hypothetical protein